VVSRKAPCLSCERIYAFMATLGVMAITSEEKKFVAKYNENKVNLTGAMPRAVTLSFN